MQKLHFAFLVRILLLANIATCMNITEFLAHAKTSVFVPVNLTKLEEMNIVPSEAQRRIAEGSY